MGEGDEEEGDEGERVGRVMRRRVMSGRGKGYTPLAVCSRGEENVKVFAELGDYVEKQSTLVSLIDTGEEEGSEGENGALQAGNTQRECLPNTPDTGQTVAPLMSNLKQKAKISR